MNTKWFTREGQEVQEQKVYSISSSGEAGYTKKFKTCTRCGGAGYSDKWLYTGRVCFGCGGRGNLGLVAVRVYTEAKLETLDAQLEKSRAKKAAAAATMATAAAEKFEAEKSAFISTYSELFEAAKNHMDNDFVASVITRAKETLYLTDRQIEAVLSVIAREVEKKAEEAAAEDVPSGPGRIVVTGKVLSTKWVESQYGGALKMLVKDARGFKVWGTVPSSLSSSDAFDGCTVTFTARLEPSRDDSKFGFFSRPTKARIAS